MTLEVDYIYTGTTELVGWISLKLAELKILK